MAGPSSWFCIRAGGLPSTVAGETKRSVSFTIGPVANPPETSRKVKLLRAFAFVVVPAAFIALLAVGLLKTTPPRDLVGKPAPQFSLATLDGGRLRSEQLKGSPVVVNFWASWCHPCIEEAGVLQRAWQAHRDEGVRVIGINVQDRTEDAAAFVKRHGITFPVARDVELVAYRGFGVRGMPETFFLDHGYRFAGINSGSLLGQRGNIKVLGAIKEGLLEDQIQRLLEKRRQDRRPQR